MKPQTHAVAAGDPAGRVGLWIEMETPQLAFAQGDERIRYARGLITGLDAMPEVQAILVPCLPAAVPTMRRLFGDAVQPDRLMSAKLEILPAGRDPWLREALERRFRRKRDRAIERLAAIGGTPSPSSWPGSLRRLAQERRRSFGLLRRGITLARLGLRAWVAEVGLATLRRLPPPHASLVTALRRKRLSARWFLLGATGASGRRLLGPKILEGMGPLPAGGREDPAGTVMLQRLAGDAAAVVTPSRHAATILERSIGGRTMCLVPPAPLPAVVPCEEDHASRQRLADELRELFSGGTVAELHRHFCDFPFEQVDYLLLAAPSGESPSLSAYAAVLRRHRRNLKLLVDGRLPRGTGVLPDVHALGLSFDVAEAAGLSEPGRGRLLRHARAVVAADLDGACLPAVFAEAVAAGTPVVLAASPAVRESIPEAERGLPEFFDPEGRGSCEEDLVRAIVHVLDHRDDVLVRQRQFLARLASRTWWDVTAESLRLVRSR